VKELETLEEKNFSLVLGGPFFQFLYRARLTGSVLELLKKRILFISGVAWLPLLLLSIINGQAWGPGLNVPFVKDFDVHIRFLVALPLLIIAEVVVHERMLAMVSQFKARDLVPEKSIEQFRQAIASALRLRNSMVAEALMVVVIYFIGYQLVWGKTVALHTSAWYLEPGATEDRLSFAGMWFRYLSLPIFQFLFIRWYYRIFIWARFLFHVSRIKLHLVPSHPDGVGGLGFLNNTAYAFVPLALAHGALLAGMISNNIFYQGAKLLDFKIEVGVIVALTVCLVVLPLLAFMSQLSDVKRKGNQEYGKLASHFVLEFERKWIEGKGHNEISAMGGDIQSLSDLSNSYSVVKNMSVLPVGRNSIILVAISTVAPVLPLLLTMMPLADLIKMLAGMLL
jgi:hypothetical protein